MRRHVFDRRGVVREEMDAEIIKQIAWTLMCLEEGKTTKMSVWVHTALNMLYFHVRTSMKDAPFRHKKHIASQARWSDPFRSDHYSYHPNRRKIPERQTQYINIIKNPENPVRPKTFFLIRMCDQICPRFPQSGARIPKQNAVFQGSVSLSHILASTTVFDFTRFVFFTSVHIIIIYIAVSF